MKRKRETAEVVASVVREIVSRGADITIEYNNWVRLGFALADEFGEDGRGWFHELSRLYPHYRQSEADKQYTACLRSKGSGVTIATFFELAKRAGVRIEKSELKIENSELAIQNCEADRMTIAREVADGLPPILQKIVSLANSDEDADLLLLGSIVTFSACLPNIYGTYGQRRVYPNLYLFVSAPASAGKGRLTLCRRLVEPIHWALKAESAAEWKDYQRRLKRYYATQNKDEIEMPQEPPQKMLIIPANASATSVFQILADNNECGLLFETEGDTLAQTFRSEHGNYSDGFRKAFHHEPISYVRRKNKEHVEVKEPRLSAVMSGTPRQIETLIPDAENGLFSRFLYYTMQLKLEWIDVFAEHKDGTLDAQFDALAQRFLRLYHFLQRSQEMRFILSKEQQTRLNEAFSEMQLRYAEQLGDEFASSVRRHGLMTFRIAMVITVLRMVEGAGYSPLIECNEVDFETALKIARVMIKHAAAVFCELAKLPEVRMVPADAMRIAEALGAEFGRLDFLHKAAELGVNVDTARRYLNQLVKCGRLERVGRGEYKRVGNA